MPSATAVLLGSDPSPCYGVLSVAAATTGRGVDAALHCPYAGIDGCASSADPGPIGRQGAQAALFPGTLWPNNPAAVGVPVVVLAWQLSDRVGADCGRDIPGAATRSTAMILILGLVILILAVIVALAGVFGNTDAAHGLASGGDFSIFGYHATGSTGSLPHRDHRGSGDRSGSGHGDDRRPPL